MSEEERAERERQIRSLVLHAAAEIDEACRRLGWDARIGLVISVNFGDIEEGNVDVRSYGNAGHVTPVMLNVMREALLPCDCGQEQIAEEVH